MICRLLLLLTLTSCVCEPTFVVKVTQSSYQAEENHHVTLEWTFTNTQGSEPYGVYCEVTTDHKELKVLYYLHDGDEVSESQDKEFSGRVQCNRDVLREGRVRLHVSRLRTKDSGLYWCQVLTEYGKGSDECRLNVTEAVAEPEPVRPRPGPGPEPESWGMIVAHVILTVAVSVLLVVSLLYFKLQLRMCKLRRRNINPDAETWSLSKLQLQSIRSNRTLSEPPSSVVSTEPETKKLETESRTDSGSDTDGDTDE